MRNYWVITWEGGLVIIAKTSQTEKKEKGELHFSQKGVFEREGRRFVGKESTPVTRTAAIQGREITQRAEGAAALLTSPV